MSGVNRWRKLHPWERFVYNYPEFDDGNKVLGYLFSFVVENDVEAHYLYFHTEDPDDFPLHYTVLDRVAEQYASAMRFEKYIRVSYGYIRLLN